MYSYTSNKLAVCTDNENNLKTKNYFFVRSGMESIVPPATHGYLLYLRKYVSTCLSLGILIIAITCGNTLCLKQLTFNWF